MTWKRHLAYAATLTIGGALVAVLFGDIRGSARQPNIWFWAGFLASIGGAAESPSARWRPTAEADRSRPLRAGAELAASVQQRAVHGEMVFRQQAPGFRLG